MEKDKLNWAFAPVFLVIPFLLAILGQLLARPMPNAWYDQLNKPSFNPPSWLFGPVWTLLYISMGFAAWLVWRERKKHHVAFPLAVFLVQLLINSTWSPVFFGLQNPGLAFLVIILLWMAILVTTGAFFRVSRFAGWLMIPYLGWVSFAMVLNWFVWRLNR